ncbi:DUF739 domain-containing protein [Helcococcus bovis]|uniref:DUF739 domain-containing protein n=1 Tax=Helcococcus bovis TaxID=3153252 RepID=UPI0038BBB58D
MKINIIKAKMVEKKINHKKLAEILKISERTLTNRFSSGIFKSDEMNIMTKVLEIENPSEIFFD